MNILVVSYSFTGTCSRLNTTLCAQTGWASGEIREGRGGRGTWRCVLDSLLHRRPLIEYVGPDPAAFDTVVLVSPVWLYRLTGPMRTFLAENRQRLHQTAFISVMAQAGSAIAAQEATALLGKAPTILTSFLTREVNDGTFVDRLQAFASAVTGMSQEPAPLRPVELSPASS
jgi:hypothetical protein